MSTRGAVWRMALGSIVVGAIGAVAPCGPAASAAAADQAAFNYPPPPQEGPADYFALAEKGQARAVILRGPGSSARSAAALLKTYLDLATGAAFGLIDDGQPVPAGLGAIHVGATQRAAQVDLQLPPVRYGDVPLPNVNGYLVATLDPQTLLLRGQTEAATLLGAVGFLKRYVGVRRYWPGEPGGLGDVVPRWPTLRLPRVEWRDWPYFISRNMSGGGYGPPPDPKSKSGARFEDFLRFQYTIPSNESYYKWLPLETYGRTHPEYFPMIEGQRYVPLPPADGPAPRRPAQGWQPCVSNPEVVRIMADALVDYFRQNPDRFAINLAVNDGLGDCTCAQCRAMDAPGADVVNRAGLCDRYVKFDNQVCERVSREFPDRIVTLLAYGSMHEPPTTVRLHPMLMTQLSPHEVNAFDMWDKWSAAGARHMGFQFYQGDCWFIAPKVSAHQWAKRIQYAVASGRARSFYISYHGTWPMTGMVGHVVSELTWDPRQDVEALIGEYYAKFYGPAARPMRRFYDALEAGFQRWLEEEGTPHPFGKDRGCLVGNRSFEQFKVLTPDEAATARTAIDEAAAAAASDDTLRKRVDIVRRIFGFAEIGARQYGAMGRLTEAQADGPADVQRILADAHEAVAMARALGDYKRDVMQQAPASHYAAHASDFFYEAIVPGQVHPETTAAVTAGFAAISGHLRATLGARAAGAWWKSQQAAEQDDVLLIAMRVAEGKARGIELANLLRDPGFEARATALPPGTSAASTLHTWQRTGTPMNCGLTTEEAHSGRHCAVFWDTQTASLSEGIPAEPGQRYALSVWVKHNDQKGTYGVAVVPSGGGKKLPRTKLAVPWKPGQWQQITTDFLTGPETANLTLHVFIEGQEPGARLWIDDFFVGRYPQ